MNFIQQKINGLAKRRRCFSYRITYLRSTDFVIPSKLSINGQKKPFRFIDRTAQAFLYEFEEICINDCYQLATLKKKLGFVKTIIDIGANQGLFSIAARQQFAKASIACYEPNCKLEPVLGANATSLEATVFYEAVTKEDCKMDLQFGESDLHTIAKPASLGQTTGTAFKKVIERAGGKIDILKMDCEGGEWEILEDASSWANIRSVTMEYHLWAKKNSTVQQVKDRIQQLGFEIISTNILSDKFGLMTAIKK